MTKTLLIVAAAITILPASSLVHASPAQPGQAAKPAALICPVTGNKIASLKDAVGHSTYKGKTYYFCCPECKPRFDKNPAKITADAAKGKYEKM